MSQMSQEHFITHFMIAEKSEANVFSYLVCCKIYCDSFWLKSFRLRLVKIARIFSLLNVCGNILRISRFTQWVLLPLKALHISTKTTRHKLPWIGHEIFVDCLFCHVLFMPLVLHRKEARTCLHKWNGTAYAVYSKHFAKHAKNEAKWINWCSNSDCEKFKLLI